MANHIQDFSGFHPDCRRSDPGVVTIWMNGAQPWVICHACGVTANLGLYAKRYSSDAAHKAAIAEEAK